MLLTLLNLADLDRDRRSPRRFRTNAHEHEHTQARGRKPHNTEDTPQAPQAKHHKSPKTGAARSRKRRGQPRGAGTSENPPPGAPGRARRPRRMLLRSPPKVKPLDRFSMVFGQIFSTHQYDLSQQRIFQQHFTLADRYSPKTEQ